MFLFAVVLFANESANSFPLMPACAFNPAECYLPLVVYMIYINDARSSKYQIMIYICWLNT